MCENVVRDVPGNYPVIWRVTKPRTLGHAGDVPKSILEVRPRLILFFFNANSGVFYVFVYSSWRPPSLFLERKPFTHETRHCGLSIIVGTEPFGCSLTGITGEEGLEPCAPTRSPAGSGAPVTVWSQKGC